MKELTIIIPCYNNAKFLRKCFDSIVKNAYKNYKVIVVDDCSTDHSLEIIKEYAKKYKEFSYIENKENKGAGYCRNKALEKCTSSYVTFLDSDDYINENYYQELMNKIKENEVIIADISLEYPDKKIYAPCCEGKETKENFINNGFAASPCNKIFKTALIKKYPFAENIMNEDICTVLSCLINGKLIYCNTVYYNYVQHKSSIQNSKLTFKRLDIFTAFKLLLQYNENLEKELYDAIFFNQIILFLFYVISKEKNSITQIKFLRQFSKEFSGLYKKDNKTLEQFLKNQSKLHRIYYSLLIKFVSLHLNIFVSLMMNAYKFYKKYFTKNVLKKNYTIEDLKKLAQKNQRYKSHSLTVVIPNYNYEKFMYQRVYSILNQKIKIDKIIILDDGSTDNSIEVIKKIVNNLKDHIEIELTPNKENSKSAFKQWQKGINLVQTKYLWIAEADDYCSSSFLKSIFKEIENKKNVSLAYTNTAFINREGLMIRRSVIPDIDIQKSGHWQANYQNNGLEELKNYSYLNCTIANVSSVIMKTEYAKKSLSSLEGYKQAGDWAFYNTMMTYGDVVFIHKAKNYYRIHGNNATTLNKKQLQFEEIKRIHQLLDKKLKFTAQQKENIEKRYEFLEKVWGIERE